ncbi:MAG: radical SAM family heme chaperone HemW [Legionellaceae bacterium]|nr:radical SAM family heme chaperone HemW [Legionellaceae bacterium]
MIPLSLYIHIPWCIRKCHYCDFNSHKSPSQLPEDAYVQALIADLKQDLSVFTNNKICSIFIGGGTPSLLSANSYAKLFSEIKSLCVFDGDIEITLEANPGTIEHGLFSDYREVGINRLSLGIQTYNSKYLQTLGRIHGEKEAHIAIESAKKSGFDNLNLDIMHSLPGQSLSEGLNDLEIAISHQPEHISWYQLTIEPNTLFYKTKPTLPNDDLSYSIEQEGMELLAKHGFNRYEISAFCVDERRSAHNMNYWQFGDYYGIGAGAHGKFTDEKLQKIYRTNKYRQPQEYLDRKKPYLVNTIEVCSDELIFEFMLNTTRLEQEIPKSLFTSRTMLPYNKIAQLLEEAANKGLLTISENHWQITPLGRQYTNNLQEIFLPN